MGVASMPAQPLHVAMFLAATMRTALEKGYGYNPVKQASAAIYAAHHMLGIDAGVTDHPFVVNVRNCAHRLLDVRQGERRKEPVPLSLCILCVQRLMSTPCVYSQQISAFIMLSFTAMLRHDDTTHIRQQDIKILKDHMQVHIPGRKNDQFRHGSTVHVARGQSLACPVRLIEALMAGGSDSAPLFRELVGIEKKDVHMITRHSSTPWSYNQARSVVLGELAATAGLTPTKFRLSFGLHSFRSGGATAAAEAGAPADLLQAHGGWRNPKSMQVYVKRSKTALLTTTKTMAY